MASQPLQLVIKSTNHSHVLPNPHANDLHPHAMSPTAHLQSHHHNIAAPSTVGQHPSLQHYQSPTINANESYASSADIHHQQSPNSIVSTTAQQQEQSSRQSQTNLPNLHVLQALNRHGNGVNGGDLDNLRKVVAVVGAITTNCGTDLPALYAPTQPPTLYAPHQTNGYAYGKNGLGCVSPQNLDNTRYLHHASEMAISAIAAEAVTSSSASAAAAAAAASVLNLSRRACSPAYEHLLSSTTSSSRLSSSSSSGVVSGDDEHEAIDEVEHSNIVNISTTSPSSNDSNNCLPLKLRHKSHLGDKDAAATALLALQHIKQEPISNRASPPWADNGDNSSDERDSGISIASVEWTAQFQRKVLAPKTTAETAVAAAVVAASPTERDHIIKSQLARLESEMANIKNILILSSDQAVSNATDLKI